MIKANSIAVCPVTGNIWIGATNWLYCYSLDGVCLERYVVAFDPRKMLITKRGNFYVVAHNGNIFKLEVKEGVKCVNEGTRLMSVTQQYKCDTISPSPDNIRNLYLFKGFLYVLAQGTEDNRNHVFVWDANDGTFLGLAMETICSIVAMKFCDDGRVLVAEKSDMSMTLRKDVPIDDIAWMADGTKVILQGSVLTLL